jgi:hypothetical protein
MVRRKPRGAVQNPERMRALVSEWEQSGISQQGFADQQGVPIKSFGYWVRKVRRERGNTSVGFVPVIASERISGTSLSGVFARLRLGDDRELVFEQEVSSTYLRSLLGW